MPTVETTITVSIPDGEASLGEVKKRVVEAVERAARTTCRPVACRHERPGDPGPLRGEGNGYQLD